LTENSWKAASRMGALLRIHVPVPIIPWSKKCLHGREEEESRIRQINS